MAVKDEDYFVRGRQKMVTQNDNQKGSKEKDTTKTTSKGTLDKMNTNSTRDPDNSKKVNSKKNLHTNSKNPKVQKFDDKNIKEKINNVIQKQKSKTALYNAPTQNISEKPELVTKDFEKDNNTFDDDAIKVTDSNSLTIPPSLYLESGTKFYQNHKNLHEFYDINKKIVTLVDKKNVKDNKIGEKTDNSSSYKTPISVNIYEEKSKTKKLGYNNADNYNRNYNSTSNL